MSFQSVLFQLLQLLGIGSRYCVVGSGASWQRGSPQKHLPTIITAVHKVGHQAIEKRSGKSKLGINFGIWDYRSDRKGSRY